MTSAINVQVLGEAAPDGGVKDKEHISLGNTVVGKYTTNTNVTGVSRVFAKLAGAIETYDVHKTAPMAVEVTSTDGKGHQTKQSGTVEISGINVSGDFQPVSITMADKDGKAVEVKLEDKDKRLTATAVKSGYSDNKPKIETSGRNSQFLGEIIKTTMEQHPELHLQESKGPAQPAKGLAAKVAVNPNQPVNGVMSVDHIVAAANSLAAKHPAQAAAQADNKITLASAPAVRAPSPQKTVGG